MLVMKFKGAVLQNQETLAEIKNRIKEQNCCSIVVVSALKGVMPRLRQLYGLSLRRGAGFENEFNELKQVHEQLAYELLAGRKLEEYKVELQKELNDLYGILHHVGVLRESSHCMKDYILTKGDILASLLFSKLFDQAEWHDSRNFMLTDGNFGAPEVLWEESCRAARPGIQGASGNGRCSGVLREDRSRLHHLYGKSRAVTYSCSPGGCFSTSESGLMPYRRQKSILKQFVRNSMN